MVVAGINGHPKINGFGALRVAFQGAPGAYSEFAAKTACPACTTVPCRAFADAIAAVERGRADRAILPVESTMEGTALRNYDLLLRHDLRIVQEINLFVHYCLLAMPGVHPAELRRVISHPMALAHCALAREAFGVREQAAAGCARLEEALGLLRGVASPPLAPLLADEIDSALRELQPQCVLEHLKVCPPMISLSDICKSYSFYFSKFDNMRAPLAAG